MPRYRESVELAVGLNGHGLRRVVTPQPWRTRAACRGSDPDLFHPGSGADGRRQVQAARAICHACPVMFDCLAANIHEELGVWGGTTERQRRALRGLLAAYGHGGALDDRGVA